jgi:hypothetical protein
MSLLTDQELKVYWLGFIPADALKSLASFNDVQSPIVAKLVFIK